MNIFDGVPEFLAVAEAGGFSPAARNLGVSVSHVSRAVARLEDKIGVRLVARTTRRVSLTQAGVEYRRRCDEIMQAFEEANSAVSGAAARLDGRLRISAGGAFGERHVARAMIAFGRAHPELSIELDLSAKPVNMIDDGFDFAIRYGRVADESLVARPLAERGLACAASPDYLAAHGAPQTPEDVRAHHCLSAMVDRWRFIGLDGAPIEVRIESRWRTNSAAAMIEAAMAGLGLCYIPRSSFGGALDDGRLRPVLEPYWTHGERNWIVYPSRKFLPARARAAIDFLLEWFKDWREDAM